MTTIDWLKSKISPLQEERMRLNETEPKDDAEKRSVAGRKAALTRKMNKLWQLVEVQERYKR